MAIFFILYRKFAKKETLFPYDFHTIIYAEIAIDNHKLKSYSYLENWLCCTLQQNLARLHNI